MHWKISFTEAKDQKCQKKNPTNKRLMSYLGAREGIGIRLMSTWLRRGGVSSLAGGVDASDKPEDPAVDGLPSTSSLLTTLFLRAGTPSGHEH
jgi:hypothetical protein